jgi:hypothetical protein
MTTERRVWTRFGEVVVVSAALGAGSLASATGLPQSVRAALHGTVATQAASGQQPTDPHARHAAATPVDPGRAGEGGEGGSIEASAITDDIVFLNLLGQVEGHLTVGVALYEAGAQPMALSHMKHPGDELYSAIKPALNARQAEDFGPALAALATAVENRAPLPEVKAALEQLVAAIARTSSVVDTRSVAGTRTLLATAHSLVYTAAGEYAIGVSNGRIVNGHEYQDAWGFTTTAKRLLGTLTEEQRAANTSPVAEVEAQIDALLTSAWPSVVPPETIATDASMLYGAAARMELAWRSAK